jgi:hypothetical protein
MSIYVCDVKFYDNFLKKYDYHIKRNTSPTKIINDIPNELKRYFYLGLFDGDGCFYISKNKHTRQFYVTSNYEQNWDYMITLFQQLHISMFEVRQNISNVGNKYSFIRIKKYSELQILCGYLYPNGYEIGLTRKYNKCLEIINNPPIRSLNKSIIDKSLLLSLIDSNKTILEISKIMSCCWRKIYDYCKLHEIKYQRGFFKGC